MKSEQNTPLLALKDHHPDHLIGLVDLTRSLGIAHRTAKKLTNAPGFPPSITLPGTRWPQWRAGAVARWLDTTLGESN